MPITMNCITGAAYMRGSKRMISLYKTLCQQLPTDTLKLNVSDAVSCNSPKLCCVGTTSAVRNKSPLLLLLVMIHWKKDFHNCRTVVGNFMEMKLWFRETCFSSLVEVNEFLTRGHLPVISIEISLNKLVDIWAYHIRMLRSTDWFCRWQQLAKNYQRHDPSVRTQ